MIYSSETILKIIYLKNLIKYKKYILYFKIFIKFFLNYYNL